MAKWTSKDEAIEWAVKNGHKFLFDGKGGATLSLSKEAGLTALACADFLRKTVHVRVLYPTYDKGQA